MLFTVIKLYFIVFGLHSGSYFTFELNIYVQEPFCVHRFIIVYKLLHNITVFCHFNSISLYQTIFLYLTHHCSYKGTFYIGLKVLFLLAGRQVKAVTINPMGYEFSVAIKKYKKDCVFC